MCKCKCNQHSTTLEQLKLRDLFQTRDALQVLVDKGFKVEDMLESVNSEIATATDCI